MTWLCSAAAPRMARAGNTFNEFRRLAGMLCGFRVLRFQPVNMHLERLEAIFERPAVVDQGWRRLVFEQFLESASFAEKVK